MTTKRIGFACILSEIHPTKGIVSIPECNLSTTTIAWLGRQSKEVAVQKLWGLLQHNMSAMYNLVNRVAQFEPSLRMVRIGSGVLPVYTHPEWNWFWLQSDVIQYCEQHLSKIGAHARVHGVRLSMHPGQFCCLASESDQIVQNSIEEFEYHAKIAEWMGYGVTKSDFKINVHIAGRRGVQGIRDVHTKYLSQTARNCITLENDEFSYGLEDCLSLADIIPTVLDIHHHYIKTGEYIEVSDDRIGMVMDSWGTVRPVVHFSTSPEDVLTNHSRHERPTLSALLESGHTKSKLRAHSDYCWNDAINQWALSHLQWADIMVEAKAKNLASAALFAQL